MKIQKRFLRKYKDKDYYKYIVNIPPMIIKESGVKYGEELEIKAEGGKIILEKRQGDGKIKMKGKKIFLNFLQGKPECSLFFGQF